LKIKKFLVENTCIKYWRGIISPHSLKKLARTLEFPGASLTLTKFETLLKFKEK